MDRGVRLDRTYQLNFGGNTDFLNMLERERLESKKISKTNAVTSMLDYEMDPDDVHVGPSRPRAVAPGPQVVLHPDGGHDLRRRAAQRGAQARGLGQPEQRRRHHRRDPLPEAGPRPRPEGHARRPVELLHEEPAGPDPRRHRPQPGRGVHPGRGQRDARRHREPDEGPAQEARLDGTRRRSRRQRRRRPRRSDRRSGLEAPHRRRGAGLRASSRSSPSRRYAAAVWVVAHVPAVARPLGDRDRVARPATCSGRRSGAGRTRTSATSSACRRTTRGPAAGPARPTASTRRYLVEAMRLESQSARRGRRAASSRPTSTRSRRPGRRRRAA